jgi:hypothetical protein
MRELAERPGIGRTTTAFLERYHESSKEMGFIARLSYGQREVQGILASEIALMLRSPLGSSDLSRQICASLAKFNALLQRTARHLVHFAPEADLHGIWSVTLKARRRRERSIDMTVSVRSGRRHPIQSLVHPRGSPRGVT